ncbi:MAG: hypothetical protein PWQ89_1185 [Verrucomicrobiota bacterium]|jgi:hypothetical protein|nr:hypothetical protein [Verrucomicrobiota bacterium]
MKNKVACNYTVLRFLPYPETGEFVNLGIAIGCPDMHWFDYLMARRLDRITGFFPELKHSKAAFIEGRKLFKEELGRISTMLNDGEHETQLRFKEDAQIFNQVFLNLVRPREEAFGFSAPRTCLTDDPKAALEKLFEHYVERSFAKRQEYQETIMTKRLRKVFTEKQLIDYYEEHTFRSEFCQVSFPFVRRNEALFSRAIHPLDLDKPETPRIVEHADHWKNRILRLKDAPEHPKDILLVVRKPDGGKRLDICRTLWKELEEVGAVLLPKEDKTGILDFAQQF